MPNWSAFWQFVFLRNSLRDWALAIGAFLVTLTLLPLVKQWVASRHRRWAEQAVPAGIGLLARLVTRTGRLFLWAIALYAGARFLEHPPRIERLLDVTLVLITWMQVALWGVAAVQFGLERQRQRRGDDPAFRGSLDIVLFVARILVFSVALLLALDNLGVNITALLAGLGVGGIAVALAVQTLLGDLLASLSIALDKPFVVGDSLRIDEHEGIVEHIGIKSVRLRSVSGEQIIVSNADVLKSRLRNLGRMPERRALFSLGVAYETPREKLELVPLLVAAAVREQPLARFEYCLLRSFGDSALVFEICYFCDNSDPRRYLETLDAVNRRIHAGFEDHAIRFAYPTRTLLVRQQPVAGSGSGSG